jgi:hypothetical protein
VPQSPEGPGAKPGRPSGAAKEEKACEAETQGELETRMRNAGGGSRGRPCDLFTHHVHWTCDPLPMPTASLSRSDDAILVPETKGR